MLFRRAILSSILIAYSLCSCTPAPKTAPTVGGTGSAAPPVVAPAIPLAPSGPTAADRQRAQEKLERMMAANHQQMPVDNSQQAPTEQPPPQPHYDPERLKTAANWRQWADITIPDFNIHAWLKSNWKNGVMHIRVALIGEKAALRIFTGSWKYLKIYFANQNGDNLHMATLATSDLHWDDGLRNSGAPTMDFEGDSEVSLEIYEQIVQWNLTWDNDQQ